MESLYVNERLAGKLYYLLNYVLIDKNYQTWNSNTPFMKSKSQLTQQLMPRKHLNNPLFLAALTNLFMFINTSLI